VVEQDMAVSYLPPPDVCEEIFTASVLDLNSAVFRRISHDMLSGRRFSKCCIHLLLEKPVKVFTYSTRTKPIKKAREPTV
jgi:hypothetical protein